MEGSNKENGNEANQRQPSERERRGPHINELSNGYKPPESQTKAAYEYQQRKSRPKQKSVLTQKKIINNEASTPRIHRRP